MVSGFINDDVFHDFLPKRESVLGFTSKLDPVLVTLFVGLRSWTVHRRTLSQIQHAKLNSGCINGLPHDATQSVDLTDEVPFRDSTYGRIATHLTDRIQVGCQQGNVGTHSRSSHRCFGSCMPGANNDDVKTIADHEFNLIKSDSAERPNGL